MGTSKYSDEFKRDAVHQITVRGYPVREVSRRSGVSTYSLYKWLKLLGEPTQKAVVDHEAENRRLKRECHQAGRFRVHRAVVQPEAQAHEQRHAVAR
jgi:transposase